MKAMARLARATGTPLAVDESVGGVPDQSPPSPMHP